MGLFTAEKPAYACLATRVPAGMEIVEGDLQRVERAESALAALGYSDFRVRLTPEGSARLELPEAQLVRAAEGRGEILSRLAGDFPRVTLDLKGEVNHEKAGSTGHTQGRRGRGGLRREEALTKLKLAPIDDMGFAKVDLHRELRQGIAEVIYGQGQDARADCGHHRLPHSRRRGRRPHHAHGPGGRGVSGQEL